MRSPKDVNEIRGWVDAEMEEYYFEMSADWVDKLMPQLPRRQRATAESFLRHNHEKGRWSSVPASGRPEKSYYEPFRQLLHNILATFGRLGPRSVVDSSKKQLSHSLAHGGGVSSAPDLLILGAFPELNQLNTFPAKDYDHLITYANVVVGIEIKPDLQKDYQSGHQKQCSVYAREIFEAQPTRHFFYFLLLTNNNVRVIAFTRSGALYSPWINIHKEPRLFIRVILGITSLNVSDIGFDDTFRWTDGARLCNYRFKNIGVLDSPSVCISGNPLVRRYHIRGRGTTCWFLAVKTQKEGQAQDKHLIAKYSWQARERTPTEVEMLEAAKGLNGVVQMFEWDNTDHPKYVSEFLMVSFAEDQAKDGFVDRRMYGIFLEAYGPPIINFETRLQFLYAFIDSIRGHQALFELGILHRDICPDNVVLGSKGSAPPNSGRIIDLDLAIWINRIGTNAGLDVRTGTRICQSINVLTEGQTFLDFALVHTYLDDLESYFWLFSIACLVIEKPHKQWNKNRAILRQWSRASAQVSRYHKVDFLFTDDFQPTISSYMEILRITMINLREFSKDKIQERQGERFRSGRRSKNMSSTGTLET